MPAYSCTNIAAPVVLFEQLDANHTIDVRPISAGWQRESGIVGLAGQDIDFDRAVLQLKTLYCANSGFPQIGLSARHA
jgi:hypothetical protein